VLAYSRRQLLELADQPYTEHRIPKRGVGWRIVLEPPAKLMQLQRKSILPLLLDTLQVHPAATAYGHSASPYLNAKCHRNAVVLVQLDLQDFFPSIGYDRVLNLFAASRRSAFVNDYADILAKLCTHEVELGKRCLVQGAPTSPLIANAVCFEFDCALDRLAGMLEAKFTRYADDITFSLHKRFRFTAAAEERVYRIKSGIRRVIGEHGFRENYRKYRESWGGRDRMLVTGFLVNGEVRAPRAQWRRLRGLLHLAKSGKLDDKGIARALGVAGALSVSDAERARPYIKALKEIRR
jgi:RNA-directed DNA polymerase